MLLACSHLVIATADVPRMTRFFSAAFGLEPHFANDLFAEFVLASRFRVAFLVSARLLASFLYGVGTADPLALAGAAAVLVAAGLLAASVPARRASRVDPAVVLRDS